MLDQETIRTFMKVAELSSFSKAAEQLHKTPATISYRIKMLEDSLNVVLFSRTTRTVTLTPAGKHLLERYHQWTCWMKTMPDELRQINVGVERNITIVINNLLYNETAVAELLSYLRTHYPFTQIKLLRHVYMGVWDALLYNDIQLAIGATGWEAMDNDIDILPLGELSWVFVVSADHPLVKETGPLTEEQLRPYAAINIEDTSQRLTKRVAWLLPGQSELSVPDMKTKLACHLKGLGIGFLPKKLCQPYIDRGELQTCDVPNFRRPSPLSLAWKKQDLGKATADIIDLFQNGSPIIQGFLQGMDSLVGGLTMAAPSELTATTVKE
jgi:LysR family transcriptional activator of the allD operon